MFVCYSCFPEISLSKQLDLPSLYWAEALPDKAITASAQGINKALAGLDGSERTWQIFFFSH